MQVTHHADMITHAVINAQAPITFGISESAEFFQILSSNLYSNQILAVCRETLCNAWDAHIEAGCTDKAIKVTIDSDKLTIRDFGPGIHHDMMGPLYGTYGGTNKRNDGKQTGGFGLGCKSPFAYADHFEVESHHQGTRTLYAISKSSAELQGKPGIVPIVSFPTTESGIEVGILLKPNDKRKFIAELTRIAHNGEMKVELNGSLIETLPMSKGESNWIITSKTLLDNGPRIMVRYGNVIYPADKAPAYEKAWNKVFEFLRAISDYNGIYSIVFQAPPHSISVTPSRESLSMQDHTIQTLTGLIEGFAKILLGGAITAEYTKISENQIDQAIKNKHIGGLLTSDQAVPGTSNTSYSSPTHIQTLSKLARQHISRHYPMADSFHTKYLVKRLDAAIGMGVGKRGHLTQLKHAIQTPMKPRDEHKACDAWFKQHIIRPLVRDLQADPVMDPARMYVSGNRYRDNALTKLTSYRRDKFENMIELQRNIVALTYSGKDVIPRVSLFAEMKTLGTCESIYVYHAPLAKTKVQAMRDFFIQRGYTLLDMTVTQPWDPVKPVKVVNTKPKKVKPVGYPALSGVERVLHQTRIDNCFLDGAPRVVNPTFYHSTTQSKSGVRELVFGHFRGEHARTILKLFGDECAVITTDTQLKKVKEDGLIELNEYITQYVIKEVTTAPNFLAYWTESLHRASLSQTNKSTGALLKLPEIRKLIGLTHHLDKRERQVLLLWEEMSYTNDHAFRYVNTVAGLTIQKARELISSLPLSSAIKAVAELVDGKGLLDILDLPAILKLLRDPTTKPDLIDRIGRMIVIALKG